MNDKRIHIHWAWAPAAIFGVVVSWIRYGPAVTAVVVIGGLLVAFYAEWKARGRRAAEDDST
jgi:Flp pilus assembly protein TadB